ncbi:MAG: PAS domain-containing protein, partial [Opitutales bacterium]
LREKVIFARQNILSDPPFSRMDMVSCRNLLIYLEPSMQKRVIQLLHFALKEGGTAVLGASESIGKAKGRFIPIHREHRIFQRFGTNTMQLNNGGIPIPDSQSSGVSANAAHPRHPGGRNLEETSRALVMDHFDAVSAIVDRHMSVRYLGGKTERYLRQPEGAPTQDLRSMVNASVGLKLRQFGKLALEKKTSQSFETSLGGSDLGRVRVTLKPIRLEHSEDGLFIIFEAITAAPGKSGDAGDAASGEADEHEDQNLFNGLGHDLKEARDELAETVAALEVSNEDLKTSNEEVMSMNEELQSSNEELETSKEELQSLNEELNTVNKQLSSKVDELERSHNDVHNLLTSTNIATIFLDEKLRIQRFTSATSRLFNLIHSDIGRPIADLAGKFDGDNLIPTCRQVLDDLKSREETVEGLDHAHYLRRVLPYRTQDNRIEGVVITFDDITELRKARKDLVQAEQYLRLAIQNSPVTIFTQDLDLKYTYILNQLAEYRSEDVIGKTDKELAPESHEQLDTLKQAVLRSGEPSRHKIQITTKEQHRLWFDVTLECLRDGEGKVTGLCCASIDITGQVEHEAELKRAKEGAEAANRAKSRFLSSMSHDIRTPLTSIMGLSEILDDLSDQELEKVTSEIHHACNHLLKTLDSVLNLARLQAGEQELPLESVDLNEILEEIRCVFDPESKRIDGRKRIRLSVDDPPIHVHAEKGALLRVFGNLVGNALKFCPDDVIEIRASREEDVARIEVADKGPGISPEFQKIIFKPFSQERDKQKSSLPGSGLGLSITHELLGLMQGRIEVESEEGKGTTMIVRLPLSQNEPTPAIAEKVPPPPASQAGDALICDDHDTTCRTLRLMLKDQPVTVVNNEAEIYQNLAGKQTLLLDINLHGKERGIKIMEDLKADPQYRHLRIVAFTAHSQPGQQEAFLEKGFDDYLSKPFQKKDLLAKLFPVAE